MSGRMFSRIKKAVGQAVSSVEEAVSSTEVDPAVGHTFEVEKYTVEVEKLLAQGGFANVYLARDQASEKRYALKKILVQINDKEEQRCTDMEIKIMRKFQKSPNIVTLFGATSHKNREGNFMEYLLLMELCPDGHLIDWMQRRIDDRPGEKDVLTIFGQVCAGLAPLHANKPPIIHRDIKPENVLIVKGRYKLCDFGSCTTKAVVPGESGSIVDIEEEIQAKTTPSYRAPEMVDLYQRKLINQKADVWAMGCLLYKLVFFDDAFGEGGAMAVLGGKYKTPKCAAFTQNVSQLLTHMLEVDPDKRVNIFQVTKRVYELLGKPVPIELPAGSAGTVSPPTPAKPPPPAASTGFADFSQASPAPPAQSAGFADFSQASPAQPPAAKAGATPRQFTSFSTVATRPATTPPGFTNRGASCNPSPASTDFANFGQQSASPGNFANFGAASAPPSAHAATPPAAAVPFAAFDQVPPTPAEDPFGTPSAATTPSVSRVSSTSRTSSGSSNTNPFKLAEADSSTPGSRSSNPFLASPPPADAAAPATNPFKSGAASQNPFNATPPG